MPTDPTAFTLDDAEALRGAIGEAVRAIRRSENLPQGQLETLGHLVRDGPVSIAELARLRRVRHQSMRVTVADLEAEGLVERSPNPQDARGVLIAPTPAGTRTIDELRWRRSTVILAAAEAALSADERAVLARMAGVLDKLTAAMLTDPRP